MPDRFQHDEFVRTHMLGNNKVDSDSCFNDFVSPYPSPRPRDRRTPNTVPSRSSI